MITRWLAAIPIGNVTAETVGQDLVQTWVFRFGTPQMITCDRCRQVKYMLFKSMPKILGNGLAVTASYRRQINGLVERLNRPLI